MILSAVMAGCATVPGLRRPGSSALSSGSGGSRYRQEAGGRMVGHSAREIRDRDCSRYPKRMAIFWLRSTSEMINRKSRSHVSKVYMAGSDNILLKGDSAEDVVQHLSEQGGSVGISSRFGGPSGYRRSPACHAVEHERGKGAATAVALTESVASALLAGITAQVARDSLEKAKQIQDGLFKIKAFRWAYPTKD